jgi:hypothetical protein
MQNLNKDTAITLIGKILEMKNEKTIKKLAEN